MPENNTRWISVKEKMPEHNMLVFCLKKNTDFSGYYGIGIRVLFNNEDLVTDVETGHTATHWMPLEPIPQN